MEELDANSNLLPTLPRELEELKGTLTSLNVSHNLITTYPGRIYKLSKLDVDCFYHHN